MDTYEWIARLSYRLEQKARGRTFTPEMLEAVLPDALNVLASQVYESRRRAALEKSYSLSLTSGAIDLSAADFSDLWFPSLPTARVLYPENDGTFSSVQYYEHPHDLDLPGVAGLYRYSLLGDSLIVRDAYALAPDDTTMTMTASFIPTLDVLASHGSLESDLLEVGAEMALRVARGTGAEAATGVV